jgi:ankyrin repeat protein
VISLSLLTNHSSYTDPKFVGIIMKEVADCNLKEYLEQSPFPQTLKPLVRGFYGSLISAVAYLHRSQMRHKDLKPQNVLVMDNKVMITDFGVALDWSENKNSQSIGRPIGGLVYTPEYMAPELEDWQPRNSQTDIYSLGLIFADILCILKGRTLVEREAYFKKLGTRTPLMRTNPAASEAWFASLERESREDNQPIRWIREMTAKRPDDRTRADVMLKKIQTFSDGEYRYYPLCCEHAELGDDHDLHQAKLSMTKKAEEEQQAAELKRSSEADAQKLAAADKEAGSADDQSFLASAKKGNLVMVKRHLLDPYANIEAKDEGGRTAMHFAAQMGLSSMMEHLIISLGNIEALDKENWTPLHYAALNGNLDEVVTLLENNALIEAQTDEGDCALHLSCRNGREDIVKELLLRGADIDRENYTGWTALFQATRAGHESIVKLLLDAPSIYPGRIKEGANLEATLDGGLNSLHIAARFGHVPLVELFIERGLDYDYPSEDGFTALHFAAQADQKAVAEVLLKRGALLNAGTKDGITPLHLAAINHSEDMAYFLIDKGADIHAINTSLMFTPLHYAATYGEFNILAVLLMNGAKIMERDFRDYTVLHCTTLPEGDGGEEAHYACAEYLLDQGIEVDARASQGLTTLHLACLRGLESIVRLLLRHKADIHAEDSETYTALDFAVIGGKKGIVSLLLERGADLGKADGRAMTIAIRRGNEEVTRLLAENGASLDEYPELLPILQIQVVRQIPISRTHSHSSRATQAMFGEAMSQNFNGHGRLRAEDQWETYTGVSDDVSEEDRLAIEAVSVTRTRY